jgi:hypothetical protein
LEIQKSQTFILATKIGPLVKILEMVLQIKLIMDIKEVKNRDIVLQLHLDHIKTKQLSFL